MTRRSSQDSPTHQRAVPQSDGPFRRLLDVDTVPENGLETAIEATMTERADIAADLGLIDVAALSARFGIRRHAGGRLALDGQLDATITQMCVVSLEPFESRVERAIVLAFAPAPEAVAPTHPPARSRRHEAPVRQPPPRPVVVPGSDEQEDPPDPIFDGRIDLGAIALEFLTLSLDLYPRKPGASFDDVSTGETDEAESPFAALQRLRDPS